MDKEGEVTRDGPPPVFGEHGEHLVAVLKSDGLGGGETADHGVLDGAIEAQQAQGGGWVRGACVIILRAADATSRLLCAVTREPVFVTVSTFLPDSEKVIVALAAASYLIGIIAHPAARGGANHQVRAAWRIVRRAADAASRLLCYIAGDPVVLHVATFLPGSVDLIVAIAAVAYLVAHYATGRGADHQSAFAHQEYPPRGWVRGARLLLPFAPAAAYLLAANFTDAPLANGVASLFLVAVAAFATLPR